MLKDVSIAESFVFQAHPIIAPGRKRAGMRRFRAFRPETGIVDARLCGKCGGAAEMVGAGGGENHFYRVRKVVTIRGRIGREELKIFIRQ